MASYAFGADGGDDPVHGGPHHLRPGGGRRTVTPFSPGHRVGDPGLGEIPFADVLVEAGQVPAQALVHFASMGDAVAVLEVEQQPILKLGIA